MCGRVQLHLGKKHIIYSGWKIVQFHNGIFLFVWMNGQGGLELLGVCMYRRSQCTTTTDCAFFFSETISARFQIHMCQSIKQFTEETHLRGNHTTKIIITRLNRRKHKWDWKTNRP